jgi:hypothetical protein
MLLVIVFIVTMIVLAAFEGWLFWKVAEQDDRRRGRERSNSQASKAQTLRANPRS